VITDKLLIITLIAGGLAIAGLTATVEVFKMKNDTLTAEKATLTSDLALKSRELVETRGDLTVSAANAARNLADKDALIDSLQAESDSLRESQSQAARIHQDISHAQDSQQCSHSDAVRAALTGLVELRLGADAAPGASGDLPADGGKGPDQNPGDRIPVPRPAPRPQP
jgi:hypothetical protein